MSTVLIGSHSAKSETEEGWNRRPPLTAVKPSALYTSHWI